jgi:hypothetical protein
MATQESGTVAVLAEKPSVARDIASVLGATGKRDGYLHGNGYVVTWAIGHLAALAQPHEIDPAWRQWRRNLLPMLPEHWPLVVYERPRRLLEPSQKLVQRHVVNPLRNRRGDAVEYQHLQFLPPGNPLNCNQIGHFRVLLLGNIGSYVMWTLPLCGEQHQANSLIRRCQPYE